MRRVDQALRGEPAWEQRPRRTSRPQILKLWFATAYTIIIIVHEAAHGLTAAALGIPSTLFNFWVNHEFAQASADERAVVFVAGPAASLLIGSASWFIYRRVNSAAGLPFLYLTAFGVTNFFGNLMSAAFVGDFSNAAVMPSLVGMAAMVLINQPTPMGTSFVTARTGEGLFWLFAAIGFLITRQARAADLRPLQVHWTDGAVAIGVILVVRVMARGISLRP